VGVDYESLPSTIIPDLYAVIDWNCFLWPFSSTRSGLIKQLKGRLQIRHFFSPKTFQLGNLSIKVQFLSIDFGNCWVVAVP
jgi:hypothetical protein